MICKQFLFLIRHRHITHKGKSSKSRVDDRGKKQSAQKGKDPLSFQIFIFCTRVLGGVGVADGFSFLVW
jgi:nitrate reductase NapE component